MQLLYSRPNCLYISPILKFVHLYICHNTIKILALTTLVEKLKPVSQHKICVSCGSSSFSLKYYSCFACVIIYGVKKGHCIPNDITIHITQQHASSQSCMHHAQREFISNELAMQGHIIVRKMKISKETNKECHRQFH